MSSSAHELPKLEFSVNSELPTINPARVFDLRPTSIQAEDGIVYIEDHPQLDNYEMWILALGATGQQKTHTGETLLRAPDTIKDKRADILRKTGSATFAQAVSKCFIEGEYIVKERLTTSAELSSRQRDILTLTAAGMTEERIAEEMGLAYTTVASHKKQLRARLRVRNIASAVLVGYMSGELS